MAKQSTWDRVKIMVNGKEVEGVNRNPILQSYNPKGPLDNMNYNRSVMDNVVYTASEIENKLLTEVLEKHLGRKAELSDFRECSKRRLYTMDPWQYMYYYREEYLGTAAWGDNGFMGIAFQFSINKKSPK